MQQPFNGALDQPPAFDAALDAPPAFDANLDKPPVGVGILGQTKLGEMGTATAAQRANQKARSQSMSIQEVDNSGDCFESRY